MSSSIPIAFYLLLLLSILQIAASNPDQTAQEQMKEALLRSLDRTEVPKMPDGKPTNVSIGLYVESMGSLNENDMSIFIDMYFRMSWIDSDLKGTAGLVTNPKESGLRWRPDVVFPNVKKADFHKVTVHNFALHIDDDGTVAYSTRISVTVACPMNLERYPLDQQMCPLKISSYAHTFKQMPMVWFQDDPIEYNQGIQLPEFNFDRTEASFCGGEKGLNYTYKKTAKGVKWGEFGCLEAQFYFTRQIGYHMVQTYFPTAAIVVISWVGFWIDPSAVPARVTLTFTTLLTLTTMGAGLRYSLPRVSYAKAIDYWYMACMSFVFAALVEFAFCNSYVRRAAKCDNESNKIQMKLEQSRQKKLAQRLADGTNNSSKFDVQHNKNADDTEIEPLAQRQQHEGSETKEEQIKTLKTDKMYFTEKATKTDLRSRVTFPLLFLVFNIGYWAYFYVPRLFSGL